MLESNGMPDNSQTIAAGLYIVATPIGNLRDITLRALDVLRAADIIACEDTRVSAKLLSHFGIKARTVSYHDHNSETKRPQLLAALENSQTVALISDAGTPLISDPGYKLVREAGERGITVFPVPGASSVTAALSVCGLPTDRFLFAGFLPARTAAREKAIKALAGIPATLVLFESARRLPETLAALAAHMPGGREAVIARELTKLYEELRRGSLPELAAHYAESGAPKGEAVIVIAPPPPPVVSEGDADTLLRSALKTLSVKDAAAQVAKLTGLPRQEIYAKALHIRKQ
jgi:16S rRNA (cytidine1402-2'-O)-methyltransferase